MTIFKEMHNCDGKFIVKLQYYKIQMYKINDEKSIYWW